MFVRGSPLYEVVGQMGFWGTLICGTQAAGLEWRNMKASTWSSMTSECADIWDPEPKRCVKVLILLHSRAPRGLYSGYVHLVYAGANLVSYGLLDVLQLIDSVQRLLRVAVRTIPLREFLILSLQ